MNRGPSKLRAGRRSLRGYLRWILTVGAALLAIGTALFYWRPESVSHRWGRAEIGWWDGRMMLAYWPDPQRDPPETSDALGGVLGGVEATDMFFELIFYSGQGRFKFWRGSTCGFLFFPAWLPASVAAVATALCWWWTWRRARPGHCPRCGYNLTGNTSGVCPECGVAVPGAQS